MKIMEFLWRIECVLQVISGTLLAVYSKVLEEEYKQRASSHSKILDEEYHQLKTHL